MVHVYRYQWVGLNISKVNQQIDPLFPATLLSVGPRPIVDLSADDSTKEDLDGVMASLGWEYVSEDPVTTTQGLVLRQEKNAKVSVDVDTVDTNWVDLLSIDITTDGGWLTIIGASTSECVGAQGYMRITIDGVQVQSTASPVGISNKFLAGRVPVPSGTYTVKLQWKVEPGGTQQVFPVSHPESEFANLIVRDVSA